MSPRSPIRYRTDMRTAHRRLSALAPATVDTQAGRICYVDLGQGFPLLLIHGGFGGYDAGLRWAPMAPTTPATPPRWRRPLLVNSTPGLDASRRRAGRATARRIRLIAWFPIKQLPLVSRVH